MKLNYYLETDSLYIDLSSKPIKESIEVSEGVVVDYENSSRGVFSGDPRKGTSALYLESLVIWRRSW